MEQNRVMTHELFRQSVGLLMNGLENGEHLTVYLSGEDVTYLRFNQGRVRQITGVQDARLSLEFVRDNRTVTAALELAGGDLQDESLRSLLESMRSASRDLPEDPFFVLPQSGESSNEVFRGQLPEAVDFVRSVLEPHADIDIVGVHQSGTSYRAVANSLGLVHWFETDAFATDYSIFHADTVNGRAVKGTFAGSQWDAEQVSRKMDLQKSVLQRLSRDPVRLKPGCYRTYMEPSATADLIGMFSYRGVSEAAIRQGESALLHLVAKRKSLSPKFSLFEDFGRGLVPRFNETGELSAESIAVISEGEMRNTLISARTAKEYGLKSNGAMHHEGLRAPVVLPGKLDPQDALSALGTGVYVSNLHYLNWSDVQGARVTGMTRYACMWVENGEFVAPIADMRFDESLFDLFGHKLESCANVTELIPEVGTYGGRQLGGCTVPGILVNDFTFTL
jgi:predicted Zn-dependent protease